MAREDRFDIEEFNKDLKKILPTIITIVGVIIAMLGYKELDVRSGNMAPLLLKNIAMPMPNNPVTLKNFGISCAQKVTSYIVQDPITYIYRVIPHYKVKNRYLGIYTEEMAGYFNLPSSEELINLEKETVYVPTKNVMPTGSIDATRLNDPSYLKEKFFIGHQDLPVDEDLLSEWDFDELAKRQLQIDNDIPGPKVLIFHTHSRENYMGQERLEDGVIAVGEALKEELEDVYGLETLHVTYDFYLGPYNDSVTGAYERMEPVIEKVLRENPSIQIAIDLHRDGVKDNVKLVGDVNGEETAQVMFVNGVCMRRDLEGNLVPNTSLTSEYIEDNLAFSMQMQMQGLTYYPEMMRKIYLTPYRYSTHMLPYSILVELGANTNTLQEAMNTVEPLAHLIAKVFEKD